MKLSDAQLREFDGSGYLFLPECFSKAEAALLRAEADRVYALERDEVWREDNGAPRTAFAAHLYNEAPEGLVVKVGGERGARCSVVLAPDLVAL